MEFVAERFRRKVVALVYAGSNPVKLPRWSVHLIGQDCRFSFCPHEFESRTDYKRFNSTAVVQLPCNEQVVGSSPT